MGHSPRGTSLAISGIALGGIDPGDFSENVQLRIDPQGGLGLHDHGDLQTDGHWRSHRDFELHRRGGHADGTA